TKLMPSVMTSHCPICSMALEDRFRLGVVITSLIGFTPRIRNNCLLKIPIRIVIVPSISQNGNIVLSPLSPLWGHQHLALAHKLRWVGWWTLPVRPAHGHVAIQTQEA